MLSIGFDALGYMGEGPLSSHCRLSTMTRGVVSQSQ